MRSNEDIIGDSYEEDWGYKRSRVGTKFEITDLDGNKYLTRWTLAKLFGFRLCLHIMHAPDHDRCHHDHPWKFWSLVLSGGYKEEIVGVGNVITLNFSEKTARVHPYKYERHNKPGTLLRNTATHAHRITELPTGECKTLVLMWPKKREWGFISKTRQWLHHRLFFNKGNPEKAMWCDG